MIGTDCLGNKYYEDMNELPLRERWVEFAEPHEYDSTEIEPGWYVMIRSLLMQACLDDVYDQ